MALPRVELWNTVGFGIIISFPSGIRYSNQTGGTCCLHPSLEGVYIPLANDCDLPDGRLLSPENELLGYFEGPVHNGTGGLGGLSEEDAKFIEGVLGRWQLSSLLKIDRTRLADSHEAWVWGSVIAEEESSVFSGFGPYPRPAVLTWSNSD